MGIVAFELLHRCCGIAVEITITPTPEGIGSVLLNGSSDGLFQADRIYMHLSMAEKRTNFTQWHSLRTGTNKIVTGFRVSF